MKLVPLPDGEGSDNFRFTAPREFSFTFSYTGVEAASPAGNQCLEVLHQELRLIVTTHRQKFEDGSRRISMCTVFATGYGVDQVRSVPTSARCSINFVSCSCFLVSRTVTPVPCAVTLARVEMHFIGIPLRIDCNLDRPTDEFRSLRRSFSSSFLGLVRTSGQRVHGVVARNIRNTISADSLPETNRHHADCGAFHERPVGGYGCDEDRERHLDLHDDTVRETLVAQVVRAMQLVHQTHSCDLGCNCTILV